MRCPVCSADDYLPKNVLYHEAQEGATYPYRCDLTMKCAFCAAVWSHGIVIPEDAWQRHVPFGESTRSIPRPEIRKLLNESLATAN